MESDVYFTDGPCVINTGNGKLYMAWPSWVNCGYAVGVSVSKNGRLGGSWKQIDTPIYPENGRHGIMFIDLNREMKFSLHFSKVKYQKNPVFVDAVVCENGFTLDL